MNDRPIYLNSYTPLIWTRFGRNAARRYGIPPFVDGSCRREPDFESRYPPITALCRFYRIAPRFRVGDVVVYITKKGAHLDVKERHWRYVAALEVIKRFESHQDAAAWYESKNFPLPSNCAIDGNPPLPLDKTIGDHASVQEWDRAYKVRARLCGVFLVCNATFLELYNPPVITGDMMLDVFGRVQPTLNPTIITPKQLRRLRRVCGDTL